MSSHDLPGRKLFFNPTVFSVTDEVVDYQLISVMMPFDGKFKGAYEAIQAAAADVNLKCQRADDIWNHSVVIQDIFSLILRSFIVVCDFTERNPNVFYEAGIAHTLGKHVVPLTQSNDDIPFDFGIIDI
jgi:hypothetical protein